MHEWNNYFAVVAGCASTLTGLIFVAVSLSLKVMLAVPGLATRALQPLVLLVTVLLVATLCLVPDQSAPAVGREVLGLGFVAGLGTVWLNWHMVRATPRPYRPYAWTNVVFSQLTVWLYLVAGGWLLVFGFGGLHYVVAAVSLSLVKAGVDAWIVLVEINRVELNQ